MTKKAKIQVNKDWKKSWRYTSVQLALITSVLSAVYASMPQFQELMEPTWYATLMLVLNIGIIILRNIQQQIAIENQSELEIPRSSSSDSDYHEPQ